MGSPGPGAFMHVRIGHAYSCAWCVRIARYVLVLYETIACILVCVQLHWCTHTCVCEVDRKCFMIFLIICGYSCMYMY